MAMTLYRGEFEVFNANIFPEDETRTGARSPKSATNTSSRAAPHSSETRYEPVA